MGSSPYRVLAVDDEAILLSALQRTLTQNGFEVETFADPTKALLMLAQNSGRFDVCLFDINMPDMDGLDLLERTKELDRELPVLMLTADSTADTAVKALKAGALDYLTKPMKDPEAAIRLITAAAENGSLRRKIRELESRLAGSEQFEQLVGTSEPMRRLFDVVNRVAALDVSVLIKGESGTGKELVARALHGRSPRKTKPFVALNCAAIPETLVDSELFGHMKGAFTGAVETKAGAFERADGGTLFLDEIGDMPLPVQTRLLRVLQEREITRVGGGAPVPVDVRVIAATHIDLEAAIGSQEFRQDLYFRLRVVELELPALRQRLDDIPLLAVHFIKKHAHRLGIEEPKLQPDAMELILRHLWPGNVRELENAMQSALAMSGGGEIAASMLPIRPRAAVAVTSTEDGEGMAWTDELPLAQARKIMLERFETSYALRVLRQTDGNISEAARRAGMDRSNLRRLMNRCGIKPADYGRSS